ncbi:MAG: 1-acyl-sn-glycerol-3-phosphate acyltransferase [Gammaproteobacteria bacterium]|nr:1-acyl-sn-glycerol-3-phosphate acyltransferase [Gammaproteobacteria bacterium]
MTHEIALPLWLVVIMVLVTAWAVWARLLIPSTRWMLRKRVNKVIDELNTRLNISIRPFQLTKRQVLIDRLVYDAKVMEAIVHYARDHNLPREVAQSEALRFAQEIVPSFNAYVYFRLGYWLARRVARLLYRVRGGFADEARLGEIDPEAAVVFVINHRSNMDYILVAFLAAEQSALSYAVGEWARIWPLQQLIRAMGAYFVRRTSNNPLYRRVLERYVYMATSEGVCQAVFPEGGLSRDGKLRQPKLGILDYMLRGFDPAQTRDVVFVPVAINYDRVLEDRTLIRTLDPSAPPRSHWFVIRTMLGFIGRNVGLMLRNRWQRFGYAAVDFGRPLSMREYCRAQQLSFARLEQEQRFVAVENLAQQLLRQIEQLIPAVPIPLLCRVLNQANAEGWSEADLKQRFYALADQLLADGRMVVLPTTTREHTFNNALHMLKLRHVLEEKAGRYFVNPADQDLIRYYAHSLPNASCTPCSGERG